MNCFWRMALALWLCSFAAPYGWAQNDCVHSIVLQLQEEHLDLPAYPAMVHSEHSHKNYEASESGIVSIDSLCSGKHELLIMLPGEPAYSITIQVPAATLPLVLKVKHSSHVLHNVTITEQRRMLMLQDKSTAAATQLQNRSIQNLAHALEQINGVHALSTGATVGKPVIHGLHSNRIVMVNNGVRMEDQQWGAEHAPNIDLFSVAQATVLKGAAGVQYGTDAIGGVIVLEPTPIKTEGGLSGELQLAGMSNNQMGAAAGHLSYGVDKIKGLGIKVQGSAKKAGNYKIPAHYIANSGMQEYNYNLAAAYRRLHFSVEAHYTMFQTMLGIYSGSHTGNQADLIAAVQSDTPLVYSGFTYHIQRPMQKVKHQVGGVTLRADTRLGTLKAQYAFQQNLRREYDIMRSRTQDAQLNLTLTTQALNVVLDHRTYRGFKGSIGIDGNVQTNKMADGDRLFIPNHYGLNGALFHIEKWTKNKWTLEAGARYDYRYLDVYNPEGNNQQVVRYQFRYSNLSGTLGIKHKLNESADWGMILSRAWRAPQANELFSNGLHQESARIEYGNKQLMPEAAWGINGYTKAKLKEGITVDVSLYRQYIKRFIYLSPGEEVLTIRGYYKSFDYRQCDATLTGFDGLLSYSLLSHWQATLKGSVLVARNETEQDYLILMPPNRLSLGTNYDGGHISILRKWHLQAEVQHVMEQKLLPANFQQIDYKPAPKAYTVLSAAIGGAIGLGKNELSINLSGQNLTNAKYRDYLDAFRYFIDQPGRNFILNLKYTFL